MNLSEEINSMKAIVEFDYGVSVIDTSEYDFDDYELERIKETTFCNLKRDSKHKEVADFISDGRDGAVIIYRYKGKIMTEDGMNDCIIYVPDVWQYMRKLYDIIQRDNAVVETESFVTFVYTHDDYNTYDLDEMNPTTIKQLNSEWKDKVVKVLKEEFTKESLDVISRYKGVVETPTGIEECTVYTVEE